MKTKTIKQKEIERMRDNIVYFIESTLAVKAQNSGELIDIKLNITQVMFLEALIEKQLNRLDIRRKNGIKS